jgi:hypothetical protein
LAYCRSMGGVLDVTTGPAPRPEWSIFRGSGACLGSHSTEPMRASRTRPLDAEQRHLRNPDGTSIQRGNNDLIL